MATVHFGKIVVAAVWAACLQEGQAGLGVAGCLVIEVTCGEALTVGQGAGVRSREVLELELGQTG